PHRLSSRPPIPAFCRRPSSASANTGHPALDYWRILRLCSCHLGKIPCHTSPRRWKARSEQVPWRLAPRITVEYSQVLPLVYQMGLRRPCVVSFFSYMRKTFLRLVASGGALEPQAREGEKGRQQEQ